MYLEGVLYGGDLPLSVAHQLDAVIGGIRHDRQLARRGLDGIGEAVFDLREWEPFL